MNQGILNLIKSLYGESDGEVVALQLERLLERYRPVLPPLRPRGPRLPLTQADAMLITYGDQIHEPGKPPLLALANLLSERLRGVVSGVHLLPFYPASSDDGFSVIDYLQVDPALGNWSDVELIGRDFDLMFDAVFNHVSAQSEWFQRFLRQESAFRDFFVTVEDAPDLSLVVRPRALPLLTEFQTAAGPKKVWTTFSPDQVDLNVKNPAVLLLLLDTLLFYVARGAKFVRLDAIAFLWKEIGTPCLHLPQTHRIIQLMRAVLDEVAPHVMLITETNVPHADNISYFGDGTDEAQLVYNFALPPLVLHSLSTGNAEQLTRWAQTLRLPTECVTFFNFLASHDGIGLNPARGILSDAEIEALAARTLEHGGLISYKYLPDGREVPYELNINYLDALSNPDVYEPSALSARKFLTAQAIMLSLRGLPGIYFHSLFGSRGDRVGAKSSGIHRRINRQKFDRRDFDWELKNPDSLRALVFDGYRELLRVRSEHPALAPSTPQRVLNLDPGVFAILREIPAGGERILCLHNVSATEINCRIQGAGSLRKVTPLFKMEGLPREGGELQVLQAYETRWLHLD